MPECEHIGCHTLYLGDCMDVLPTLGNVDAVVTDPPYGLNEAAGKNIKRGKLARPTDYGDDSWDKRTVDEAIPLLRNCSTNQVIFGGNYYDLPPTSCWLIWDKENGNTDFADCEMAWTNLNKAVRLKRYMWNGMLRANNEPRGDHPTQKPVGVMEWVISHVGGSSVLDPFMGSGTTGVACVSLGRKFIGVEKERRYFDIACKRIEAAQAQGRLF